MQFFIYFFIILLEKSLEAVTMATGMQPRELGINYLVLCENTKNPESFIKIHDCACQTWVGGYGELLLIVRLAGIYLYGK